MAEDTPQANTTPVKDTQVTPTPSVDNQKTTNLSEDTEDQNGLPNEASERTRARVQEVLKKAETFESQLKEERQRREQLENAFRALNQPKQQVNDPLPLVDPTTGLIDERALTALQKEAKEAREEARVAKDTVLNYQKRQEEMTAYGTHPWMNPDPGNKQFDKKKYALAVGIAMGSMVRPDLFDNKQMNLKEAGDFIAGLTPTQVEKLKQEAAQEAIERLSPKEQAALEATGTAGRRGEADAVLDYETVRQVQRRGGKDGILATMARLNALQKTQAKS